MGARRGRGPPRASRAAAAAQAADDDDEADADENDDDVVRFDEPLAVRSVGFGGTLTMDHWSLFVSERYTRFSDLLLEPRPVDGRSNKRDNGEVGRSIDPLVGQTVGGRRTRWPVDSSRWFGRRRKVGVS